MFLKKQTDSDEWMDGYPTALNAPLTDTQSLFQKAVTRGRKTNRKKSIVCGGKSTCYYDCLVLSPEISFKWMEKENNSRRCNDCRRQNCSLLGVQGGGTRDSKEKTHNQSTLNNTLCAVGATKTVEKSQNLRAEGGKCTYPIWCNYPDSSGPVGQILILGQDAFKANTK